MQVVNCFLSERAFQSTVSAGMRAPLLTAVRAPGGTRHHIIYAKSYPIGRVWSVKVQFICICIFSTVRLQLWYCYQSSPKTWIQVNAWDNPVGDAISTACHYGRWTAWLVWTDASPHYETILVITFYIRLPFGGLFYILHPTSSQSEVRVCIAWTD